MPVSLPETASRSIGCQCVLVLSSSSVSQVKSWRSGRVRRNSRIISHVSEVRAVRISRAAGSASNSPFGRSSITAKSPKTEAKASFLKHINNVRLLGISFALRNGASKRRLFGYCTRAFSSLTACELSIPTFDSRGPIFNRCPIGPSVTLNPVVVFFVVILHPPSSLLTLILDLPKRLSREDPAKCGTRRLIRVVHVEYLLHYPNAEAADKNGRFPW